MLQRCFFWIAVLAMFSFCSVFLNRTNNYLGTVPIATDDDAISNVAINLWKNHRYGFPAHPSTIHYNAGSKSIASGKYFDSTDNYYNYGWFYFVVAGFLNWTVGDDSMHFFRMMNPWGLIFIAVLGFWLFSRVSLLPGALLSIGLFWRFLLSVSPTMARPDIAVSVTVVLFFIFSFFAMDKNRFVWWFLTGFFAATAATTHLVAWSVALAAVAVWLLFILQERSSKAKILRSFFAIFSGGLLGIFIFLSMMGFRIEDLWVFITSLEKYVQQSSFFNRLVEGIKVTWTSSGFTFYLAFAGCMLGGLLLVSTIFIEKKIRQTSLALLAAPIFTTVFYTLSLGTYSIVIQPGYGILAYVSAMWTMAAAAAVLVFYFKHRIQIKNYRRLSILLQCFSILLLTQSAIATTRVLPNLEKLNYGWVKFVDYERQVMDALPQQAYVWGMVNLGFTSGVRSDFIDSNSGFGLALHYNEKGWERISPDYLALNSGTLETYLREGPMQGKDSPIAILRRKLPSHIQYKLIRIVYAPPYGNTFLYQKFNENEKNNPYQLSVAVNDGSSPQWHTTIGEAYKPQSVPVDPVIIDQTLWNYPTVKAKKSIKINNLKRGFYLVRVRVEQTTPEQTGAVIATPSNYFFLQGDIRFQHAPLFRGQTETFFIIDHLGGELYFSYFPGRASRYTPKLNEFKIDSIQPVIENVPLNTLKIFDLPDFSLWKFSEGLKKITTTTAGEISIQLQNPENIQSEEVLTSPPIPVKENKPYVLVLPSNVRAAGSLAVGIFTLSGKALLWGEKRPLPQRIGFYTYRTDKVILKIFASKRKNVLDFSLSPGVLISNRNESSRVDELLSCVSHGKWIDGSNNFCNEVNSEELRLLEDDLLPKRLGVGR